MIINKDQQNSWLTATTVGYVALLITVTTLVLGTLCKFLKELCRKIRRKRRKRKSTTTGAPPPVVNVTRSESVRSEKSHRRKSRSDSTASKVSMSNVDFSIPKIRTDVLQQPPPELSQARTAYTDGPSKDEKRKS